MFFQSQSTSHSATEQKPLLTTAWHAYHSQDPSKSTANEDSSSFCLIYHTTLILSVFFKHVRILFVL